MKGLFIIGSLIFSGLVNQTVVIPKGIYSSMTIDNPFNSIVDASQATFTGGINITNSNGLTILGGTSKNFSGDAINWQGTNSHFVERGWRFLNIDGNCNNSTDKITYNGDTSTLSMYMGMFDNITAYRSGLILQGAWGETKDLSLFADSIVFSNVKIDSTLTNGTEVRGVIFRLGAYNWNVTYNGINNVLGDVGVFYIYGNVNIHDNFKSGGRGYWLRLWHSGLNLPANSFFYNNIDLNTTVYGTADIRSEEAQFGKYVQAGGSMNFYNNTSGNKGDNIGYWSQMAVIGACDGGFIVNVNKNIGFNINVNGKPSHIIMDQSNGTWKGDSTGNVYYNSMPYHQIALTYLK